MKSEKFPVVVSTWPFLEAVRAAWRAVDNGSSAVEAVVEGCSTCEELRCDGTGGLFFFFLVPYPLNLLVLCYFMKVELFFFFFGIDSWSWRKSE